MAAHTPRDRADRLTTGGPDHDLLTLISAKPWPYQPRRLLQSWIHTPHFAKPLQATRRRHTDRTTGLLYRHTRSDQLPKPTPYRQHLMLTRHQHSQLRSVATTP